MFDLFLGQAANENSIWVNIITIIILFIFGKFVMGRVLRGILKISDRDGERGNMEKRAETVGNAMVSVGNLIIYIIITIMVLGMFGVDVRPILAGIGILGLAVGFGAQSLVKDFVSGLFIILEGQYDVGDKVKIGSSEGKVTRLSMRSTVLKDSDGSKYYISNGSVNNVVNYSQKKKTSHEDKPKK